MVMIMLWKRDGRRRITEAGDQDPRAMEYNVHWGANKRTVTVCLEGDGPRVRAVVILKEP